MRSCSARLLSFQSSSGADLGGVDLGLQRGSLDKESTLMAWSSFSAEQDTIVLAYHFSRKNIIRTVEKMMPD